MGFDPYSTDRCPPLYKKKISLFDKCKEYGYTAVTDLITGNNDFQGDPFFDWNLSKIYKLIHSGYNFKNTSLMTACPHKRLSYNLICLSKMKRKGLEVGAMILLENGFEPMNINSINTTTPLHQAAELGNREVIDLLMKNGAHVDLEARDASGFTPLMTAFFCQQAESFSCLVHYGVNLNVMYTKMSSLKHYIINGHFPKFISDLVKVDGGRKTLNLIRY